MKQLQALTNQEILKAAPSAGALSPFAEVSDRYQFVPTIQVVDLLRSQGWLPMRVQEAGTRTEERRGFQKHLVRFQHPNLVMDEEAVETILINSHDRSCAYQVLIGIFRFVCENGMIVGDTFDRISIRHINYEPEEIIEASYKVIESAPAITSNVKEMKAITLSDSEQQAFSSAALQLLYDAPEEAPIKPDRLLRSRRYDDRGQDLWRTFNRIQENIMKGGVTGFNRKNCRHVTTRPVKSIDRNVRLNKALWTLTEKMMALKTA